MSFWKKWFNGSQDAPDRGALDHPSKLQVGDYIKFGFLPQSLISNQRFEVISVDTYDFEGDTSYGFTLKNEQNQKIYTSFEPESERISISRPLSRKQVNALFNSNDFSKVFDEGFIRLTRLDIDNDLTEWTTTSYRKEVDCAFGYFHEGDYRGKSIPKYEKEGDKLDFYSLVDDEANYEIEIEVYEGGETDILATVYHPLHSIDEMWPSHGAN